MAYSDDISAAPDITAGGGDWDNLTATDNAGEPTQPRGGGGNSIWQKVFLSAAGSYRFTHDTSVSGDTVMAIYTASTSTPGYADLTLQGSGDDEAGSGKPSISYASPGGEWVYIASSGYAGARVSGQTTLFVAILPPAPGSWVDCRSSAGSSSYLNAWAADMGVYTGPWPLMPTAVTAGMDPSDDDEIDFVLGFPNPSDPTNPFVALDGSYDSQIWGTYRYVFGTGPTDFGLRWYTAAVGSATAPDGSTPPPPGVHLYVLGYIGRPIVEPTNSPESYVPTTYTASGTATTETFPGGWSVPQAPIGLTGSVSRVAGIVWQNTASSSEPGDSGNATSHGAAALASLISGIVWVVGGTGTGTFVASFDLFAEKAPPLGPLGGGDSGATQASIDANFGGGQATAKYPIPTSFVIPDPTESMVYNADYGDEPFTSFVEYEYLSAPAFDSWSDTDGSTGTYYHNRALNGASVDLTASWRVQTLTSLAAPADGTLASGSTILDIPVGGPGTPTDSSPGIPFTLTGLTAGDVLLLATPGFYFDGVSASQFPDPSTPMAYGMFSQFDFPTALGYNYETGTWRYWLPNYIGPSGVIVEGAWGMPL